MSATLTLWLLRAALRVAFAGGDVLVVDGQDLSAEVGGELPDDAEAGLRHRPELADRP